MSNTAVVVPISTAAAVVSIAVATIVVIKRCTRFSKKKKKKMAMMTKKHKLLMEAAERNISSEPACAVEEVTIELGPIEQFLDEILRERPMRFTSGQLAACTKNYACELGSGGFGVVYKGELPNGLPVAVKVLKVALTKKVQDTLIAEIGTIGRTYHMNLVRLYGFCFDADTKALVYEFMENGSLDKYLYGDSESKLEWKRLHEIAVGTAKGIRYLHEECRQKIIHYDIKPANILLTANFTPKVADFGLARLCDQGNTHMTLTGGRGTPGYAAPDLWMALSVTEKCDVYSFGMLMFEIMGKRRNFDFGKGESREWYPRWVWERYEQGEMESIFSHSEIEEGDLEKAEMMCKVALWCVQFQPSARPTMSSVVRMLEGEMDIVPPVNPFQYMMLMQSSSTSTWESGTTNDLSSGDTGRGSDQTGACSR